MTDQSDEAIDREIEAYCENVARCDDPVAAAVCLAALLYCIDGKLNRVLQTLSDVEKRLNALEGDRPQHTS